MKLRTYTRSIQRNWDCFCWGGKLVSFCMPTSSAALREPIWNTLEKNSKPAARGGVRSQPGMHTGCGGYWGGPGLLERACLAFVIKVPVFESQRSTGRTTCRFPLKSDCSSVEWYNSHTAQEGKTTSIMWNGTWFLDLFNSLSMQYGPQGNQDLIKFRETSL